MYNPFRPEVNICPICHNRTAKTEANPKGICPAYSCPNNKTFYEQNESKEDYKRRTTLTETYRTLYFHSPSDHTLHFLYGLSNGNMLFIDDVNYNQYIYNENELKKLARIYPETNYHQLK